MPKIEVTVTPQIKRLLKELAKLGLFGVDVDEVARRFIDAAVVQKLTEGFVKLPRKKK